MDIVAMKLKEIKQREPLVEGALVLAGNQWTVCFNGKLRTATGKIVPCFNAQQRKPALYVVPAQVYADPTTPEHAIRRELLDRLTTRNFTAPVTSYNPDGPQMTAHDLKDGDLVIVACYDGLTQRQEFCVMFHGKPYHITGACMGVPYAKRRLYAVSRLVVVDKAMPEHVIHKCTLMKAMVACKHNANAGLRMGMASMSVNDKLAMGALALVDADVRRVKLRANVWLKPNGKRTAKVYLHVYPKTKDQFTKFGDITRRFTPKRLDDATGFTARLLKNCKHVDNTIIPVLNVVASMVDFDAIATKLLREALAMAEAK